MIYIHTMYNFKMTPMLELANNFNVAKVTIIRCVK